MTLKKHKENVINHHLSNCQHQEIQHSRKKPYQEQVASQKAFFDSIANWFISDDAVPEDVVPRLHQIVTSGCTLPREAHPRFLDIGCGSGALFPAMIERYPHCHITGVDLSALQLQQAKKRYSSHNVAFWQGDILDFPVSEDLYDAAWCNACFGNLYDQQAAVQKIATLLKPSGRMLITHPLGLEFVQTLHEKDPALVPNTLPANQSEALKLITGTGLEVEQLIVEPDFYVLVYQQST